MDALGKGKEKNQIKKKKSEDVWRWLLFTHEKKEEKTISRIEKLLRELAQYPDDCKEGKRGD